MSDERPVSPPPDPPGQSRRRSALETGFERWLDRQLHKIYDPVLDEGIPDDLARLLDGFDARTRRPGAAAPADEPPSPPPGSATRDTAGAARPGLDPSSGSAQKAGGPDDPVLAPDEATFSASAGDEPLEEAPDDGERQPS